MNSTSLSTGSSLLDQMDLNGAHKPRVLAILPSFLPSAQIYTIKPLSVLANRGLVDFNYVFETKVELSQVRQSDCILYVRNDNEDFNFTLEEALALHIPTVYDIDDNFWEIPPDAPSASYHRAPERMRQVEHYLRSVSVVRVYNRSMEERVRQFTSRIFRATAGIDVQLASTAASPAKNKKIKIAYVTGRGSKDELYKLITPDLKRLLDDFPEQVEIFLWKDAPSGLNGHPAIQVVPIEADYTKFLRDLASAGYDIGLAPLLQTTFYMSKTNTKFRDYGACRLAGIYSDVDIYRDCVTDGVTGLLVGQTPGEWYTAMVRLIQDEGLRKKIQESAYQYVFDHYRQEIMESEWLDLLDTLAVAGRPGTIDRQQHVMQPAAQKTYIQWGGSDIPAPGFKVVDYPEMGKARAEGDISLPFSLDDDSVDIFLIIDRLETVEDLNAALSEIYRVCKHGAQVCIIGRYAHNQVYQADQGIRQTLNEHSPRYWTFDKTGWIYQRIFSDRDDEVWGLKPATSGNFDLRCVQMDFFYNKEYRSFSAEEKRKLRHKYFNVCDRIFYRLLVIKKDVSHDEMNELIKNISLSDPVQAILSRYEDRSGDLEELAGEQAEKKRREDALGESKQTTAMKQTSADNYYQHKAKLLVSQVASLRRNRLFRLYKRFFDRQDAWKLMPSTFDKLKHDSLEMGGPLNGFRLALCDDLMTGFIPEYPLIFTRPDLREVQLAVAFDLPLTSGEFGIELIDPSGEIVLTQAIKASEISEQEPAKFQFPALNQTGHGVFTLRVFARQLDVPLRLFELQLFHLAGLGRREVRCFAGFGFEPNLA